MIQYKNLKEHIKYIANAFKRRGEFYRKRGLELTPSMHTFLWSQRRYLMWAGTRSVLAWDSIRGDAPTIEKWHNATVTNRMIVRRIQDVLIENKSASISRFVVECEGIAKRETVRRCVNMGVELGLIEKVGEGYAMTALYADELFNRAILGLRHPDMIEWARMVLAVNQAETIIQHNRFPRRDDHPLDTPLTLAEEIAAGRYTGADDE
jgi:hypothetical protein